MCTIYAGGPSLLLFFKPQVLKKINWRLTTEHRDHGGRTIAFKTTVCTFGVVNKVFYL